MYPQLMTFQAARKKLTIMYTSILAVILVTFSIIIYNLDMGEVYRSVQQVRLKIGDEFGMYVQPERVIVIDTEALNEARRNIVARLILANILILVAASAASYYLAGKTLEPIQTMTEQQQQFVADASHELRTPLTVMKSTTEITLRDKNLSIEDAKLALNDNLEEINRLQRLTNNLLTLSVNESGNGLAIEDFDATMVVEEAIQVVKPLAIEKQIEIQNQVVNTSIQIDLDSTREVLVILLENAIKYSPKNAHIKLSCRTKKDHLEISVQDEGIGMDQNEVEHIFNRFYRAENSRTSKGFGLGLAIAHKLISLQKGTIRVASQKGQGTVFTITLPKA